MIEYDVFISHNTKDKVVVRELVKKLKDRDPRLKVWMDEERIDAGDSIQDKLEEGIERSRTAAVLVGKDGFGPWEKREVKALLQYAVNNDKRIIPVLLPGTYKDPKLPLFLGDCRYVNLKEGLGIVGIEELLRGITKARPYLNPDNPTVKREAAVDPAQGKKDAGVNDQISSSPKFTTIKSLFFNVAKPRLIFWSASGLVIFMVLALMIYANKPSSSISSINFSNLSSEDTYRSVALNIDPIDAELSININGIPYTECKNIPCQFFAPLGSVVEWKVEHQGYQSKKGRFVVNVDNKRDITLE
jgi:hypothetical protein